MPVNVTHAVAGCALTLSMRALCVVLERCQPQQSPVVQHAISAPFCSCMLSCLQRAEELLLRPALISVNAHALQTIGDAQFMLPKINQWSSNVVEGCLKRLAALNKPFKYVVTCNMTQKAGAGLHTASCTRWNEKTDGKMSVQWENQTMLILVTVYWLAT